MLTSWDYQITSGTHQPHGTAVVRMSTIDRKKLPRLRASFAVSGRLSFNDQGNRPVEEIWRVECTRKTEGLPWRNSHTVTQYGCCQGGLISPSNTIHPWHLICARDFISSRRPGSDIPRSTILSIRHAHRIELPPACVPGTNEYRQYASYRTVRQNATRHRKNACATEV